MSSDAPIFRLGKLRLGFHTYKSVSPDNRNSFSTVTKLDVPPVPDINTTSQFANDLPGPANLDGTVNSVRIHTVSEAQGHFDTALNTSSQNHASSETPRIVRFQQKIKMTSHNTIWYIDKGGPGDAPMLPATFKGLNDGDLYLHVFNGKVSKVWLRVSKAGTRWKRVQEGVTHPTLSDRVLIVRGDQKPSWILPQSAARYRRGSFSSNSLQFVDTEGAEIE